jgi:uncharacterized membrane protein YjjP (DUF1212 family)
VTAAWWLTLAFALAAGVVALCGLFTGQWESALVAGATTLVLGLALRALGARLDGE